MAEETTHLHKSICWTSALASVCGHARLEYAQQAEAHQAE